MQDSAIITESDNSSGIAFAGISSPGLLNRSIFESPTTAMSSRCDFDQTVGPQSKQAARSLERRSIRFPDPGRSFKRKSPFSETSGSICTNLIMVEVDIWHTVYYVLLLQLREYGDIVHYEVQVLRSEACRMCTFPEWTAQLTQ